MWEGPPRPGHEPKDVGRSGRQGERGGLKKRGVEFVGPASGRLACGPDGEGRMVEVQEILDRVIKLLK
jgi:hypothetical protein